MSVPRIQDVSKSKKTMYVGKTFKIKTNIKASKLTFKSSNKKIAKVTKSGVIKPGFSERVTRTFITQLLKNVDFSCFMA